MKGFLSQRDTRALVRGAAVIGTIVIVARGLPAWRSWESTVRRDAASSMHAAAMLEAGVTLLPKMRDSTTARRLRLDWLAGRLFEALSVPEATAALAVRVSAAAADVEVKVNALQLRGDSAFAADGFASISIRMSGTGDIAGLAGLLGTIEGDSLLLTVREIVVTQPEPAAPDSKPEALRFEVVVEGLAMHPSARGGR